MAYSSEIEKLRARYNENPKGRNFAPLADAYRKAKQLDEAILLCREGLQLHPDYVSAHIVLGRCLVDRREDAAAGETFRRVLELDPENIIALKMLADIAMRGEHPLEAVEWLTRLLQVDPMNGEAADALALARGKAAMVPATEPEIDDEAVVLEVETVELTATRPEIEAARAPTVPMAAPAPKTPARVPPQTRSTVSEAPIESYDGRIDFSSVEQAAAEIEGLTSEEPETVAAEGIAPADGLARSHYEGSGMFKVDVEAEPAAPEPDEATTDLPLIMPDELELSAPPVAFASEARAAEPAADEAAAMPLPARPRGFPDDDGAADQAALSSAEPVLTETMAELYLRQGHVEDALRVYQRLLEGDPGNAELQARIDALTGARRPRRSGPTATEFLRNVLRGDRVAPPVVVEADAAAAATAPDTVMDEVFDDLAPEAPSPHAGAPTQPAAHPLSLERVFGEPGRDSVADATLAGAAAVGAPTGFSFDDFFAAGESLPPEGGVAPTSAAGGPAAESSAQPSEAEQDLDQFQAWLRSLKS